MRHGTKSQMRKQLEGVELDGPARIGGTLFQKGVPVLELILYAQAHWQYKDGPLEEKKPIDASERDSWVHEMFKLTTEYHIRTGKKVEILDLYDAFLVESIKQVDPDDRASFEHRLRERCQ